MTDSLRMTQLPRMASLGYAQFNLTSNYCWSRFTTWALRGETTVSDRDLGLAAWPRKGRATLVVPPNTPAFSLRDGNATSPLAVLNVSNVNARGKLQPNILMSAVVQSIDIVVGHGNPAAVGARMRGAQGSSLEDVAVYASNDTFAGVSGCSGSGGAHSNITVVGARFGIDARDTQPAPTLSNIRLFNQTCASLIHTGVETLTIAGAHVVVGPAAPKAVPAMYSGAPYTWQGASGIEGFGGRGTCRLLSPQTDGQPPHASVAGAVSLVDAVFECRGCHAKGRAAVGASRGVYLRRVRVEGFDFVAQTFSPHNSSGGWNPTHLRLLDTLTTTGPRKRSSVTELSYAVPNGWSDSQHKFTINATQYVDGKPIAALVDASGSNQPWELSPEATCDQHGWGDNARFPTHASAGAINAMLSPYDAIGDGITDDTSALQRAVSAAAENRTGHAFVFLPRGAYRISATIHVPSGVRVVGLARHLTTIVSSDRSFSLQLEPQTMQPGSLTLDGPSSATPMLSFADGRQGNLELPAGQRLTEGAMAALSTPETVLFGVTLVIPVFNNHTNTSMISFRSGVGNPGSFNVLRQFWTTRIPMCGQWWSSHCAARFYHHPPYPHAYTRIEGDVATARVFVLFQEDGVRNGGAASQSPFYRKLLVNGTRERVTIYQLNGEHSTTTAYSEFANVSGVEVFGSKSEMEGAVIFVRDSHGFSSYGHGGPARAPTTPLPPEQCDGQAPCPWLPALFRVVNSTNIRFVSMQGQTGSPNWRMLFEATSAGAQLSSAVGDYPSLWKRS